jgi:hypothetical protein
MEKKISFHRNRNILSTGSVIDDFKNAILIDFPETKLDFEKIVYIKAAFPGSIETVKVYIFEAYNSKWFFNKFFCWTRKVVEYGSHRLLTYTVPGYSPDNPHSLAKNPEEAVETMAKLDKDYTVVKDN